MRFEAVIAPGYCHHFLPLFFLQILVVEEHALHIVSIFLISFDNDSCISSKTPFLFIIKI